MTLSTGQCVVAVCRAACAAEHLGSLWGKGGIF